MDPSALSRRPASHSLGCGTCSNLSLLSSHGRSSPGMVTWSTLTDPMAWTLWFHSLAPSSQSSGSCGAFHGDRRESQPHPRCAIFRARRWCPMERSRLWTRRIFPTTSFPWVNDEFIAEQSSIAAKLRTGRAERFSNDALLLAGNAPPEVRATASTRSDRRSVRDRLVLRKLRSSAIFPGRLGEFSTPPMTMAGARRDRIRRTLWRDKRSICAL